ncbi:hypothetical protein HMPREF0653_00981 [Prevotella disiens JCM 6334 = ATCC 29426]|uniref:Uncharacterized protein n=2 Tax=Prevotella disiens TaxID=28130 RepID=A0A379E0D3_9BACT|nr:hypothetical protein HMPREF0653_00981 [Prevotella disiens JCM 6334 = ATCC 29426]SUB86178.1 Uncharacterised protein [Prevotella disiens]
MATNPHSLYIIGIQYITKTQYPSKIKPTVLNFKKAYFKTPYPHF